MFNTIEDLKSYQKYLRPLNENYIYYYLNTIYQYLLIREESQGADINERYLGDIPLKTASHEYKRIEIAKVLIAAGAKDNICYAIERNDLDGIQKLIADGEDIKKIKCYGESLLEFAKSEEEYNHNKEIAELLKSAGAK